MSDQSVPRQSGPGESPRSVSGRGHRFEKVLPFAPFAGMGTWPKGLVAVLTQIADFGVDRYTSGSSLSQGLGLWPDGSVRFDVAFYTCAGSV